MKAISKSLIILLIFFLLTDLSTAAIKSFKIRSDNRPLIIFGKFGFTATGFLSIAISNVSVTSTGSPYDPSRIGFFLVWDLTPNQLRLELQQSPGFCVRDSILMFDSPLFTFSEITDTYSLLNKSYDVTHPDQYSLFVVNCNPESFVTMDVRIEAYNIYDGTTKDYLSAGLTQLPSLYFIISLIYINFLAIWIRVCFKNQRSVHRIHLLMGALLTMQAVSMFCNAEERRHVKATGTPQGWDVMFYVFHFVNNVLLFTVIMLIGAGWSYLKPFLQKKEIIFLIIMIPVQVLGSVAFIVNDVSHVTGVFSKERVTWSQVSTWTDAICWCAVFYPIVWWLKEPLKTDEKYGRHLSLFIRFYLLVVSYLWLPKICVFALEILVDYRNLWVFSATEEIGSLVFYLVMFYMFRPVEKMSIKFIKSEYEEATKMAKDEDYELLTLKLETW
ncbi:hypothetical protein SSX86_009190 [Deinandra increscens subsp. villosa]|uniref:Intimal thickness related receptor IRP domain-containing protein n=1 Tax=Deinandra increscens subsp. villosa TaxID=3103831 RepID=A0AAP0DGR3_9ASTR